MPPVAPNPNTFDPLDDFERRELTFLGTTRLVYVAGKGNTSLVHGSGLPGSDWGVCSAD